MKKILLQTACLFAFISTQAQVANGNFEDWTKMILFDQPFVGVPGTSSNYETFFANGTLNVMEVPNGDGSAMRLENMTVGQEVIPAYYITGSQPTQEGESLLFKGGFQISDTEISGISFDARYSMTPESPGFVIVQFKNGDTPVGMGNMGPGTFVFQMSGNAFEWATMNFEFDTPISSEANTCVVGFAAADLLANDQNFVAGTFLEVDNLSFVDSDDDIFGNAFENWAPAPPIWTPDQTVVEVIPFADHYVQSEESHTGQYALELRTVEHQGNVLVGQATIADGTMDEMTPSIEIADGQNILEFYYTHTSEGEDMGMAEVTFYQTMGSENVPVYTHTIALESAEDYTLVSYDFGADLAAAEATADKMVITFASSADTEGLSPVVGSSLKVDDVALSGVLKTFWSSSSKLDASILAYPNPTLARTVFYFGTPKSGTYELFNSQFTLLGTYEFTNETRVVHNLQSLPAGQYTFRFFIGNAVGIKHVIKL